MYRPMMVKTTTTMPSVANTSLFDFFPLKSALARLTSISSKIDCPPGKVVLPF